MRLDLLISHFVGRKEGGDRRKGREGRKEGRTEGGRDLPKSCPFRNAEEEKNE